MGQDKLRDRKGQAHRGNGKDEGSTLEAVRWLDGQPPAFNFHNNFSSRVRGQNPAHTITFASKYGWKTAFLGAILGLAAVNLIGALIGQEIGNLLPHSLVKRGAGILFIVFGVLMLMGKL